MESKKLKIDDLNEKLVELSNVTKTEIHSIKQAIFKKSHVSLKVPIGSLINSSKILM